MLAAMIDAFVVEVGALCAEPGEQLGTLVEVQRTERFRIAALSPAAAETAGMQLFSAAAARSAAWCATVGRAREGALELADCLRKAVHAGRASSVGPLEVRAAGHARLRWRRRGRESCTDGEGGRRRRCAA